MSNQLLSLVLVFVLAAGLWLWVSTVPADTFLDPLTLERERTALSVEEQIRLGRELAPAFERELGGLRPGQDQARIGQLGEALLVGLRALEGQARARTGQAPRWTPFPFTFKLLGAATVNAFALPGGPVYVTAGLWERLSRQAQRAAVLGHEIGHVVLRHSAKAFEARFKGNLLLWVIGAAVGEELTFDLAQGVNTLLQLGYSREQESQADAFGAMLLCAGGYDPAGLIEVLELLGSLGEEGLEWLSTHPTSRRRIARVRETPCSAFPSLLP